MGLQGEIWIAQEAEGGFVKRIDLWLHNIPERYALDHLLEQASEMVSAVLGEWDQAMPQEDDAPYMEVWYRGEYEVVLVSRDDDRYIGLQIIRSQPIPEGFYGWTPHAVRRDGVLREVPLSEQRGRR